MMDGKVTAREVARLAGVSQPTVSRAFMPNPNVSPDKLARIFKVAEELGYRPNAIARSMVTRKTKLIGMIIHDMSNPFYSEALDKFSKALGAYDYHILFVNTETAYIQDEEVYQLLDYHVEGVIVTDAYLSSGLASRFSKVGIPVIFFNRYEEMMSSSVVCCNNVLGGRIVGNYLLQQGLQRMAFIEGTADTSTTKDREKGFREILEEHGQTFEKMSGHFTYRGGYQAATELLGRKHPPQAIFCANDIMAIGAIDAARIMGLSVPDDVSIIGFDDIAMAEWPTYSLTTVKQPMDEMIQETVELILKEDTTTATRPEFHMISGQLMERKSVKIRSV
jgi:DNA-binding LacI/PurR family transcriptional regulator